MANNTNNYAEEAANIIENTITEIKRDYENFLAYLVREGQYYFYNKQGAFVQRMMFFDWFGDYEKYRNNIKNFIFGTTYRSQRSYDEQDAKRAGSINEVAKKIDRYFDYNTSAGTMIEEMIEFRKKILNENPILTSGLTENVREYLMDTILRNCPNYQKIKKSIDKYLNRIVSTLISEQKDKCEREYYKN